MRKGKLVLLSIFSIFLLAGTAGASMVIPNADQAKENSQAPQHSPVIDDEWDLERVDFIHYLKTQSAKGKPGSACYKLMGVKWSSLPVSYVVNPINPDGLSWSFVTSTIATSGDTWDAATAAGIADNFVGADFTAVYGVRDYKNAVVFGDYPSDSAIAVTSVWYTRIGKQIVEFDMILNTRFDWGDATINPAVMDLQNIATHEFGHAFGLSDIYNTSCSTVTMYGYSGYGDTSKRTLEQPDITGLQMMYGL